jgi:ABC-2 type transport system ATP-binding protein
LSDAANAQIAALPCTSKEADVTTSAATIEVRELTKRYGSTVAVNDLSFDVHPGRVTGFLGPNGAGKSTTLRVILGLDQPESGSAIVNGRPFALHHQPLFEVGALLDPKAFPGRSALNHLRCLALANGIARLRVDKVLDLVGLTSVARKRAGGFSLGMGQRLGLASALLGDPHILILDEPINGLDPDGILWIRNLLRSLADEGRTVLVSSHLMSEMALTADHLIVIGRGRLLADDSVEHFIASGGQTSVRVRSPQADQLAQLLGSNAVPTKATPGTLTVTGMSTDDVGMLAGANGITVLELSLQQGSLEEAFMELTHDSVEYHTDGRGIAAAKRESAA